MFSANNIIRKTAMVGLAAAAVTVPALASSASAAPADQGPNRGPNPSVGQASANQAARAFMANRRNEGVCVRAHIEDFGWTRTECGRDVTVGTTGRSKGIEALQVMPIGIGGIELQGHVQDFGWGRVQRARDGQWAFVGTTGQDKRLEAVRVDSRSTVWLRGHVQNIGWQRPDSNDRRGPAEAGTTGRSLRLESLQITIRSDRNGGNNGGGGHNGGHTGR